MATPNDRRVIWGSHVIPQEAIVREEGVTTYKLDTTIAKRFGGKGSVDINSEQDIDGWVSFFSPIDATWDLRSESGGADDDVWEDTHVIWDGERGVTTSGATLRSDTVNVDFLYIKNTGDVEFTDATCDYNNDPTIAHDDDDGKIKAGMMVSGTGIPADSYVGVRTSDTSFELYSSATGGAVSTTGGSVTNGELTFTGVECHLALEGNEYDIIIPGGAAVSMRVDTESSANIKVKTLAGTTVIEYVIAKTP